MKSEINVLISFPGKASEILRKHHQECDQSRTRILQSWFFRQRFSSFSPGNLFVLLASLHFSGPAFKIGTLCVMV